MSERYVVKEGSVTGHCCFESTVVDTINGKLLCECLDKEDAKLICDALNAMKADAAALAKLAIANKRIQELESHLGTTIEMKSRDK